MNQSVSGRWNGFQRTMLQWNGLHPYNAVHAVRLPGSVDLERLRWVVGAVLEQRGLTGFSFDAASFRYEGGAMREAIPDLACDGDALDTLAREIEVQLNRPFDFDQPGDPFRFFTVRELSGTWLALVYFHPVADAEVIVRLLRDIVAAYRDPTAPASFQPWNRTPRNHDWLILRRPALLLRWFVGLPAAIRSVRASHRPAYRDPTDQRNGFRWFTMPAGTLTRLMKVAKDWGVSVNDVFLAAILLAVSPWAADRFKARRRRLLSVASIVNIRRELPAGDQEAFGLALGSFRVAHAVPSAMSLGELARAVQAQTSRAKRHRSFLATSLPLALARWWFTRSPVARRHKLYLKNQPLCAGLTNLNLNSLWPAPEGGERPDYFRAVSTGPATPLVFSITTAGGRLNVGVSFRTTVFLNSEVERVQDVFQQSLANIE